jgi:succinate dehydrogenase / fumarate reductase membrane anchor subunit
MTLRSPLGRARGLGSAKEGVAHFWWQRMTGLALVPLALWFVASVISLAGKDYAQFHAWLAVPCNAMLMCLLVLAVFHHGQLGLQVVIEDYVHQPAVKFASLIAVKFAAVLFAVFAIVAVGRVTFAGG